MKTVLLHLERLRRHYEAAVRTYDHVSLLDLSHSLRIWTELKNPLIKLAPKFSTSIAFKSAVPAKKVLKAARGHKFVFAYMPGGVITYASKGHLTTGPDMDASGGDFTAGIAVKFSQEYIELGKYCVISTSFDQPLVKALDAESISRCNYIQWLGAEAVRVSYLGPEGDLKVIAISREKIVKRVANTLDGSHASAAAEGGSENLYDAAVQHLMRYQMGGLPLPYLILLKVAQDILEVTPKLLGIEASPPA